MSGNPASRSAAVERMLTDRAAMLEDAPMERIGIDQVAGRTLAEDVTAPRDVPPHDYATMDGFAVAVGDRSPVVTGTVFPEDDPPTLEAGETVRVATGAPLPSRADAVLKREDATVEDGTLAVPDLAPGTNVYPRGGTARSGERLLAAGTRLGPRHAALLSDVGIDALPVHRRFDVAVVATGTEIHEGRQPDRDSDMLAGLVGEWGHVVTRQETVPDDTSTVWRVIEEATAGHDAVVTTGGTSVGSADHVSGVLRDHDLRFGSVSLRPGRPVTAASVNDAAVIALPGKPVAAYIAALLVARPFFTGETALPTVAAEPARRVAPPDDGMEYAMDDGMEYAIPVVLDGGRAMPLGHADSSLPLYGERFAPGLVAASTRTNLADGFVLAEEPLEPGTSVGVVPYGVLE